jgi:hypothetical protein
MKLVMTGRIFFRGAGNLAGDRDPDRFRIHTGTVVDRFVPHSR